MHIEMLIVYKKKEKYYDVMNWQHKWKAELHVFPCVERI